MGLAVCGYMVLSVAILPVALRGVVREAWSVRSSWFYSFSAVSKDSTGQTTTLHYTTLTERGFNPTVVL